MDPETSELKHGTFVKVGALGVLVLGTPGSGKSALALALIDGDGRGIGKHALATTLIADDQVHLWYDNTTAQVFGRPPESIAGLLEIRGLGIVQVDYVARYPVGLVVQIRPEDRIERLPDFPATSIDVMGQAIPMIEISDHNTNAAAIVRAGVCVLLGCNTVENTTVIR